jgi:uncharacterized protein (UPF0335 family)
LFFACGYVSTFLLSKIVSQKLDILLGIRAKLALPAKRLGLGNKLKGQKMSVATKAKATTSISTTKATKVVVEQVRSLVEVRAEIARLEKEKLALTAEIEKAFGVNKEAKFSDFDTLTHQGIEFVRYEWRSRKGIDEEKLAKEFPEAYEACFKADKTVYGQIVSLYK